MIDGATAEHIRHLAKDIDELRAEIPKRANAVLTQVDAVHAKHDILEGDVTRMTRAYYEQKVEVELLQDAVESLKPPSAMFYVIAVSLAFLMGILACYGAIDMVAEIQEHTPQ